MAAQIVLDFDDRSGSYTSNSIGCFNISNTGNDYTSLVDSIE